MNAAREMSLREWVERLPVQHNARKEFEDIIKELAERDETEAQLAALRSPSPAQGMYSVEDINEWMIAYLYGDYYGCEPRRMLNDLEFGIAAWKAKQPPSANDASTRTVLPDAVELAVENGDTLIVEPGMDGGHTLGVYVASLATSGECVTADTPEAAIDALAAQLAGKDKRLDAGGK